MNNNIRKDKQRNDYTRGVVGLVSTENIVKN